MLIQTCHDFFSFESRQYSSVPNTGYVTLNFFGKKFPSFGPYLVRNFYSFGKIVPPITIIKYITFSKKNESPFIR